MASHDKLSRLSIETDPPVSDVQAIERGLFSYEEGRLGNPLHAHFAVMLRTDTGQIQGGADCHVMWHRVFVKTLWLPETLRGRGLGTQIMLDVEAESVKRRCLSIWLTALGDHACHFYRRLGYTVFGVHEDYIGGQALYSVRKDLTRGASPPPLSLPLRPRGAERRHNLQEPSLPFRAERAGRGDGEAT